MSKASLGSEVEGPPSIPGAEVPSETGSPMSSPGRGGWSIAIATTISLMLHSGAVYLLLRYPLPSGASDVPTAAISVNLVHTAAVEPAAKAEQPAPGSEGGESKKPAPDPQNEAAARLKAEEEAKQRQAEAARLKAEAEAREAVEREKEKAEVAARAKAIEEERRKAQEAAERQKAEEERRQKAQTAKDEEAESERHSKTKTRSAKASAKAGSAGGQLRGEAKRNAHKAASNVSASFGQELNYRAQVRAHLSQNRPGRNLRLTGVVVVAFGLTEAGGLTYARISSSSGNRALDQAVLSTLRGAVPFPRAPAGLSAEHREFSIPLTFKYSN